MATAWRSRLVRFPEPRPLLHHYPHRCYYLIPLVWLIFSLASFFLMEVSGVEARVLMSSKGCCLQRERDALLLYKAAIEDPSARLSSWRAQVDCCAWTGVVCHNRTGSVRVAELNLQNPNALKYNMWDTALMGELMHPSLFSLTHLQSLNLSFNDFEGTQIPPLVGSLHKLRYLDLYGSTFGGTIPPHLGNLTDLRFLRLSSEFNSAKAVRSLDWLSGLSSLIFLGMSHLDLSTASHNWISAVNMLPSLQVLYLYDCRLNIPQYSLSFHLNLTSLVTLCLGGNNFNSSFPNWLWNLTTLSSLVLPNSQIRGALPNEIGNLINLTHLNLYGNWLSGPLPISLWKLKHLSDLHLSSNLLGISFPIGIMNLSSLSTLGLRNCSLSGRIPSELGNLTTLKTISLSYNSLSGPIPIEIWKLVNLNVLQLSFNSLEGEITEFHHSTLTFLDLSYNKISGPLPLASVQSLTKLYCLNLGSNRLKALIPHLPPNLNMSNNAFSEPLPLALFCNSYKLEHLDVSNNQIYGKIPPCWQKNSFLEYINLGNNMLFGEIPSSLGNLMGLEFLHLNNNNLKGQLPSSLQNCTQLLVVDLGDNKLSGNIPSWIGQNWQYLGILRLRSNMFNGNIDPQLGYLPHLQIVDFANNKLSGPIPRSFGNFSMMISTSTQSPYQFDEITVSNQSLEFNENITLIIKGYQFTFSSILYLVKSIDLSNNGLTDEIPEEIGYLVGLHNLNLSRNYFRGKIPDTIGRMSSLETLDLSFNNLSGIIPQSLSQLNALNKLNLSFNNLSGSIPSGYQLQTLDDVTIYIGNPYLCGDIVNKSCFDGNNTNPTSEEHAMLSPMLSIYLSSTFGYFIGLWSVFVLLLFKKKWRYFYFKKVDEIYDKVYVTIKIR